LQVVPPVQAGAPPVVEQKEKQVPLDPLVRQVLPDLQSLAWPQVSPGFFVPAGKHIAPVSAR
jgi:hypothetical protein